MKSFLSILLLIVSCSCFANEDALLYQFKGAEFNSNDVIDFENLKGQIIYVDFWASWCPPCLKSIPFMEKLHHQFKGKNFKIVAINIDKNKDEAIHFLKQHPITFLNLYDPKGKIGKQLKVKTMPTSFLFDENGKLLFQHSGFDEEFAKKLQWSLAQLLEKSNIEDF